MSSCLFTDGKVERSTQTTHHLSISVGVNVSSSTPQMSYPSLLEKAKYNRTSRFFSDDMALTNGFQVMELLSRRDTLKPTVSSQVEVEDDRLSLGSLLSQHLSFPPLPMPLSPNLHDPMSPAIHEPGPSFAPAVSPDLFSGGEDIGPTPTGASQSPSSSDDLSLLFREQYQNEVLEVIDQDLNAGQTVMAKIQMKGVSQKGRKSATSMSFLGQVSKVSEWKVLLLFFKFS